MKKLAIFDKDGTLTTPKSGERFVQFPEDQVLLPGVLEGIQQLRTAGWEIAIASNQGGVAAGYKTLDEAILEVVFACRIAGVQTAVIAHSYEESGVGEFVSVHCDDATHEAKVLISVTQRFRKPNPGMIRWLARKFGASHEDLQVIFVGDRAEDEQAAANAGVEFIWAEDWRNTYLKALSPN